MSSKDSADGVVRTILRMRALAGRESEFADAWKRGAEVIRRAPGCLRQDLMRNPDDPREFVVVAEWSSRAALDAFSRGRQRNQLSDALIKLREKAERSTYEMVHSLAGDGQGVRVLVTTTVPDGGEADFEAAYRQVADMMRGTPGHVREELLHEPGTPTYHLLAEWSSKAAFLAWVSDPRHTDSTGPLVPYLTSGFQRRIFTIAARPEPSVVDDAPADARADARAASSRPSASEATEVLVVGAGPTGMTLALELARRGVAFRLVEQAVEPPTQADKAIGVHCRTMEIWEDQGIVQAAIDAGVWLDGQIVVVNGRQTHQVNWDLPDLTYAHLGLPQYETERILEARLASLGVTIERGVALRGFSQDDTGVTARLSTGGATGGAGGAGAGAGGGAEQSVRASYVVGCDGAHSAVRKGLNLTFEAGAGRFPELFMLADVEVDLQMPERHMIRFMHETDGQMDGMLVCVPLKGNGRYRLATLAPPRVIAEAAGKDVPAGFLKEFDPPTLEEVQVAVDQLAPPGTRARNLRWSSVFRISHGIVDRYRVGRVFVAGDAAHLHPPAGGQGMNTGIQDAYNLGWKLATAVAGKAAPALLDSYEAERRPAALEIVGRAVRIAFTDEMDHADEKAQFLHEMQLTMTYHGTPWVGEALGWDAPESAPAAGDRVPDLGGLRRRGVGHPMRLFELTAGICHTLLLYADATTTTEDLRSYEKLAAGIQQQAPGLVDVYLVAAPDLPVPGGAAGTSGTDLPLVHDAAGEYRARLAGTGPCAYLVRPDGHVGFRTRPVLAGALEDHLRKVFTP